MSPKHTLITTVWCAITMIATLMLSHGHLIIREILTHWPTSQSWEGRLESAVYTQGGLVFLASLVIGGVLMVRSHLARVQEQKIARKELSQRDRHERAAASRHEAMMDALAGMANSHSAEKTSQNSLVKKR